MIDLTRARAIDGWMTEPELAWLAAQAQGHQRIVEVGSYRGRSTRALGDHTPGWVLAFDDWQDQRSIASLGPWPAGTLLAAFRRNLADLLAAGKVRVLEGAHDDCALLPAEFLLGPAEQKPDMVFLDGDHRFESVQRELLIWRARLAPGGLLCGHDYESCEGVRRAVRDSGFAWERVPGTDLWALR